VKQSFRLAILPTWSEPYRQEWPACAADFPRRHQWFTNVIDIGGTGFASTENEVAGLLAPFPDDNPSLHFQPGPGYRVSLEIGGGAQRSLVKILAVKLRQKDCGTNKIPGNPAEAARRLNSTLRQLFPPQNAPMSIACTFSPAWPALAHKLRR